MFWASLTFATSFRGLDPLLKDKYASINFKCDGDKTIPITWVNDDYCDCKDGSDEIGTSACESEFYCHNDGMPLRIPSAWVDDGKQDCCDGSDEKNNAKNTCAEFKLKLDEKKKSINDKFNAGVEEKRKYIQYGLNWRAESKSRLIEIDATVQQLNIDVGDLDGKVKQLEKGEQFENDLYQCNNFCLDNYSKRYDLIFEELKQQPDPPAFVKTALEQYEDIKSNPSPIAPTFNTQGILGNLLDWIPFIPKSSTGIPNTNVDNIDDARSLLSEKRQLKSQLETEKTDLNSKLQHELGIHDEWAKSLESCTSSYQEGKNYEFCFFGSAKQDGVLLGRFAEWKHKKDPRTDFNPDDLNDLTKLDEADVFGTMKYSYGSRCWNGQDRFVDVVVKCADKFEILYVTEPSMCTYTMTVTSPAACPHPAEFKDTPPVPENENDGINEKDEL